MYIMEVVINARRTQYDRLSQQQLGFLSSISLAHSAAFLR